MRGFNTYMSTRSNYHIEFKQFVRILKDTLYVANSCKLSGIMEYCLESVLCGLKLTI